MSIERERAVSARTKLILAVRLIDEARAELTLALPGNHPATEHAGELHTNGQRVCLQVEMALKRLP